MLFTSLYYSQLQINHQHCTWNIKDECYSNWKVHCGTSQGDRSRNFKIKPTCLWKHLKVSFTCCPSSSFFDHFNPLNAELNPICCLLALLGSHHFLHVSRIRVISLTLRLLMSYIYIYIYIWSTYS